MAHDIDLSFAADFPLARREEWLKLVDGVLKGAPFEKRLVSKTYDGLTIEPLYAPDIGSRPLAARPGGAPWQVLQRVLCHERRSCDGAQLVWEMKVGPSRSAIRC